MKKLSTEVVTFTRLAVRNIKKAKQENPFKLGTAIRFVEVLVPHQRP